MFQLPRHKIPAVSASAVPVLGFLVVQFVLCHVTLQWRDLRHHVDHQLLAEEKCLMLHKKTNTGWYRVLRGRTKIRSKFFFQFFSKFLVRFLSTMNISRLD